MIDQWRIVRSPRYGLYKAKHESGVCISEERGGSLYPFRAPEGRVLFYVTQCVPERCFTSVIQETFPDSLFHDLYLFVSERDYALIKLAAS